MNAQVLSLNSEVLEEFRINLDGAIRVLAANLTEKDLATGTVTAKLEIDIRNAADNMLEMKMMEIEPDISIKIGAKGKMKCSNQSGIFLKYDEDGLPIIGESQMTIDEFIREREELRNI